MKYIFTFLTIFSFLFISYSHATEGYYASGFAGVNLKPSNENTVSNGETAEMDFNTGSAFGGAFGYRFTHGFRLEGEMSHHSNGISEYKDKAENETFSTNAKWKTWNFMVNGYYDFEINKDWGLTPYVGLGIGLGRIKVKGDFDADVGDFDTVDDKDDVFAYQGIAGIDYKRSEDCKWGIFLEYRFMATSKPKLMANSGLSMKVQNYNNMVNLGLKYFF